MMSKIDIYPCSTVGSHKTEPNIDDDPYKVEHSWCATVVDQVTGAEYTVGVWDYKGVRWSTYGNQYILERIFKCSS